ncbi:MAG: c-type cytochrome [Thermoanaerobaculia bacterium]
MKISRSLVLTLAAASLLLAPAAARAGVEEAAKLYKGRCAMCHGADGSGRTAAGAKRKMRDLRSAEVQKQSDPVLGARIRESGAGTSLQAHRNRDLSHEQVSDLVAYIRTLASNR